MSCASFIQVSDGTGRLPRPIKSPYDKAEEHAALIGLQALTLNLASANQNSEPSQTRKKCLKPLRISTARKTPEKHVSISPLPVTPRSAGSCSGPGSGSGSGSSSSSRSRPSPCRSDSSGFHSLPSPSCSIDSSKLFTNNSNVEINISDSTESINTRVSGNSGSGGTARGTRHVRPRSRQSTPQPRQSTPQPRQSTPQPRQDGRGDSPRPTEEFTSVFDVQNVLKKGELLEGVLRFDRRSGQHAYISAPVNLGRADGHLRWRRQQ